MVDILSVEEGTEADKDSGEEDITIAIMANVHIEELGPPPPPRRPRSHQQGTDDNKPAQNQPNGGEKKEGEDLIDISGGLFGDMDDQDEDALPPTLWWDDIGRTYKPLSLCCVVPWTIFFFITLLKGHSIFSLILFFYSTELTFVILIYVHQDIPNVGRV